MGYFWLEKPLLNFTQKIKKVLKKILEYEQNDYKDSYVCSEFCEFTFIYYLFFFLMKFITHCNLFLKFCSIHVFFYNVLRFQFNKLCNKTSIK